MSFRAVFLTVSAVLFSAVGKRVVVHEATNLVSESGSQGPQLKAKRTIATFGSDTYQFDENDAAAIAASEVMAGLNLKAEWSAFLTNLNQEIKSGSIASVNAKGKELAAAFNSHLHGEGKKVTFYTRRGRTRAVGHVGQSVGFYANHFLQIREESDNTFLEMHENKWGSFDRVCCCRQSEASDCKFSAADGKCCKFKYGDTVKHGCSVNWFPKSTEKVDDAMCKNGPEAPAPPEKQSNFCGKNPDGGEYAKSGVDCRDK